MPLDTDFFYLPLEIRTQIYMHLFGRGFICFHKIDRNRLDGKRDTPIYALHPPYHLEAESTRDRSELEKDWFAKHPLCSLQPGDKYESYHRPGPDCPDKLHMALLCTCRRIHAEASHILWSTTLVHFEDPDIFTEVMERIGPANRAALWRLSLDISWVGYPYNTTNKWSLAISSPLVKELTGLRTLSLDINIEISETNLMSTRYGVSHDAHIDAFDAFATLDLETVEIHVGSREIRPYNPFWKIEDRQQYAGCIRAKLLEDALGSLNGREMERQMVERYRLERLKRLLRAQDRRRAVHGPRTRYSYLQWDCCAPDGEQTS